MRDPGRVGGAGGDHLRRVRISQGHRGAGQIWLVRREERGFVLRRHREIANSRGDRPKRERFRH